VFVLRLHTL